MFEISPTLPTLKRRNAEVNTSPPAEEEIELSKPTLKKAPKMAYQFVSKPLTEFNLIPYFPS